MSRREVIYRVSCYLVGALFIFSGVTKAINPFGLSIQFAEYFTAMGLDSMQPLAPFCAVFLPVGEMVLGLLVVMGYYRRWVGWIALGVMSFFTVLTLWIMVTSPVKDCGCFGDLLLISNTATFFKNLIFMIPTVALVVCRSGAKSRRGWREVVLLTMVCGLLPLYSYNNLPLIDATPFKVGVNVWEAMHDATPDESTTTLLYKNIENSEVKEFEITDPEWQDDSKWEFIETKTVVTQKGRAATITQLPIINSEGEDVAEELLNFQGSVMIMVAVNPERDVILEAVTQAEGVDRVVLLHSSPYDIKIDGVEVYNSDFTTLRTLIQNVSGGKIWLRGGEIERKSTF